MWGKGGREQQKIPKASYPKGNRAERTLLVVDCSETDNSIEHREKFLTWERQAEQQTIQRTELATHVFGREYSTAELENLVKKNTKIIIFSLNHLMYTDEKTDLMYAASMS